MLVKLSVHERTPPGAPIAVECDVHRDGDALVVRFILHDPEGAVSIERWRGGDRTDGLWRTTCFEAFARPAGAAGYIEVNVAPSGDWATYRFDAYREGMRDAEVEPTIDRDAASLSMRLDCGATDAFAGADWDVALSAVIEEKDGTKSYWALAHPAGAPDFHHRDCFALQLAAPEAA